MFSTIWALVGHNSHLLDLCIFTMRPGSPSTLARANIKSLGYQARSLREFSNPSFRVFLSSTDLAHGKHPSSAENFAPSFTCILLTANHRGSALVTKTKYSCTLPFRAILATNSPYGRGMKTVIVPQHFSFWGRPGDSLFLDSPHF